MMNNYEKWSNLWKLQSGHVLYGEKNQINYVQDVTVKYQNICNEKSTIYEAPADFYIFFWIFMFLGFPNSCTPVYQTVFATFCARILKNDLMRIFAL